MSSIRKNSIFMVIYEIAVYLAPFITAPYVARVLGTYGTGIYSYSFSIVSYFVIFVQLGVSLYGRREIASCLTREKKTQTFWAIWTIETIMFVFSLISFLTSSFFVEDNDLRISLYIQTFYLMGGWLDISWLYFGVEDFKIAVSRNVIVKVLSLIAVFIFVNTKDDTLLYVFIMSLSNFLGVIVMWLTLRRHVDAPKLDWVEIKKHISPMFKMFIPVLSIQLFSLTDKLCLGLLSSIDDVSIYDNAYRISRVPVAFITTIGTVMLPRMTKYVAEKNEDMIKHYFNKSLTITFVLGLFSASILIGVAPAFIPLYLGESFTDAILVLQLLSIVLVPIAWGNAFRSQYILPQKLDNLYLKSVLYAAIINIVLNLVLIPLWSTTGAAVASIASELIICIYQSIKIKNSFDFRNLIKKNIAYLLPAFFTIISMICITLYLEWGNFALLIISFIVGILVFVLTTYLIELKFDDKTFTTEVSNILKIRQ